MTPRALLVVALLVISSAWAQAQSLAAVARAEEARRQEVAKATKVYTNGDLKPDPGRTSSPPPAPSTAGTSPAGASLGDDTGKKPVATVEGAAEPVRDQAYWAGRIGEARSQLDRNRSFAAALQNRIDMLWADFVNRDNPVERSAIEKDRNDALAELARLKQQIEDGTAAVAAIEEEGRRAGVPAAWLRPS